MKFINRGNVFLVIFVFGKLFYRHPWESSFKFIYREHESSYIKIQYYQKYIIYIYQARTQKFILRHDIIFEIKIS